MSGEKRSFTIEGSSLGIKTGHYKGKTPGQAARKAAKMLYKRLDKHDDRSLVKFNKVKNVKLMLRETTRGSPNNVFYYEADRTELNTPKVIERKLPNGEVLRIEYKHKISVKGCEKF